MYKYYPVLLPRMHLNINRYWDFILHSSNHGTSIHVMIVCPTGVEARAPHPHQVLEASDVKVIIVPTQFRINIPVLILVMGYMAATIFQCY